MNRRGFFAYLMGAATACKLVKAAPAPRPTLTIDRMPEFVESIKLADERIRSATHIYDCELGVWFTEHHES